MIDRIPRSLAARRSIIRSLGAGTVPRNGVENISIGRQAELAELRGELEHIREGGAAFRVIVGRYGAGKSFMLQLLRNVALKEGRKGFVVADADISPQHRLTGSKGEGLALYRRLLTNMATRTRPNGNGLGPLIERWISDLQSKLLRDGIDPESMAFERKLHGSMMQVFGELHMLTHGFDFATVLSAYTRGHRSGDDELKAAALRWLRGEYHSKSEARRALRREVSVMIDDATWYDNIKLLAYFARQCGYSGLLIFLDEAVHLSQLSHRGARENNYQRLLNMVNDATQGHAEHLGIYIGATPEAVEDQRRGFFSSEALETRLRESSFSVAGLRDLSAPLVRLDVMGEAELRQLLAVVRDIHDSLYRRESGVTEAHINAFLREAGKRIGADSLLTPRELLRDFVTLLELQRQHRRTSFEALLGMVDFATGSPDRKEPAEEESLFSEFAL